MKKTIAVFILLAGVAASAPARAEGIREIGAGVIAGEPVGGTLKAFLDDRVAFDAGAGFSDGNGAFWGDLLWHDWTLAPQPTGARLGVYFGAGPQLRTGDDVRFGIRTIAGLSYRRNGHPLEVFAEAGPLFRMTQGGTVDAVGGVGIRLYWATPSGKK